MKLLFDQNLSPTLVARLADIYPHSSHVHSHSLDTASDLEIWDFARSNDYVIVTKDADFSELSALRGFPAKIVWLQFGNCKTGRIEEMLRMHRDVLGRLAEEVEIGIVKIY